MSERSEWIGVVLAALGNHIRHLEDENAKLRYQVEAHEAFREFDRQQEKNDVRPDRSGADADASDTIAATVAARNPIAGTEPAEPRIWPDD